MPPAALPAALPTRKETTETTTGSDEQVSPLYNVILLDDDDHSFPYVIEMLQTLIGCPSSWGWEMAEEVHTKGRVIIDTTTLEKAQELQRKVHGYGADPRILTCKGSMTAILEPTN